MTFPFGTVVPSSLNGRIDTALHIVPAGALEVASMGTGCLLHPQELKEWQLLPFLLIKFLFSLAGDGRAQAPSPTPDSPQCVSQGWPGLMVWPMGENLPWAPVPSFGAESVEWQAGSTGQL